MKANKLFLVILVISFVTSCKTVKQSVKTVSDVKTSVNTEVKTSDLTNKNIDANFSEVQETSGKIEVTDKSTSSEVTVEETTKTDFSAPDSTGTQYKKSEIKSKKTTTKGENKNLSKTNNTNSKTDQAVQLRDQSNYKSDSTATDKTKQKESDKTDTVQTDKIKSPVWLNFAIVILVLGLIGLIYLVLKRFGAIK